MKYISAKLNNFVSQRNILANIMSNDVERLTLRFILWSFATLLLVYAVLLGNIVFNIVERRSLELHARALSNEVGELELSYLSLSSGIDLDLSHSLGFKETKASFATRKSLGYQSLNEDNDL